MNAYQRRKARRKTAYFDIEAKGGILSVNYKGDEMLWPEPCTVCFGMGQTFSPFDERDCTHCGGLGYKE